MSRPERVLVLSREYPPVIVGGTATVARNLATGLAAGGADVTVLTTGADAGAQVRERVEGVRVHRIGAGLVYNADTGLADMSLRMHRRLHAAAEALAGELGPPDLVTIPDLFCFPEASMFSSRHRVPLVNILLQDFCAITPYDRDVHRVTNGVSAQRSHLVALEEKAVRGSAHTVFISRALSDAITARYPANPMPHSVIHLGVDPAEIVSVRADPGFRRRREEVLSATRTPSDRADRPLLVACGRLVPVKGYEQLLHALRLVDGPAAPYGTVARPHLALVGVGPEEDRLRRLAAELGLSGRVSFLGAVPRREALGWMSVADVAVVPSLWESFCYVCAEMMAFGRPVVASAVDSLNELMPTDEFGYRVPVTGPLGSRVLDPADLADALRRALAEPAQARARGEAARRRVLETFTNDRFTEGFAALGRRLLRERTHD